MAATPMAVPSPPTANIPYSSHFFLVIKAMAASAIATCKAVVACAHRGDDGSEHRDLVDHPTAAMVSMATLLGVLEFVVVWSVYVKSVSRHGLASWWLMRGGVGVRYESVGQSGGRNMSLACCFHPVGSKSGS